MCRITRRRHPTCAPRARSRRGRPGRIPHAAGRPIRRAGDELAPLPAEETADWFQAWTGNSEMQGDNFRVFGQDGTGGYAAFWLVRPDRALAEQPVVFLGSEGETGVVARDLGAFLWLLADGCGPMEAATSYKPDWVPQPDRALEAVAEQFAPTAAHPQLP
ncbi:hypothetical protein [Streptomyces rimosus]|uniref:hypothetical protein n=1 Tax=Streptomyces rimosus TaxID=1927 RepID=UPI003CD00C37